MKIKPTPTRELFKLKWSRANNGISFAGAYIPLHLCPELRREHGLVESASAYSWGVDFSPSSKLVILIDLWHLHLDALSTHQTQRSKTEPIISTSSSQYPKTELSQMIPKWLWSPWLFLLRQNLCNIKVAFVKCAIQWHLVHPQRRAAITTIWFHHPKRKSHKH